MSDDNVDDAPRRAADDGDDKQAGLGTRAKLAIGVAVLALILVGGALVWNGSRGGDTAAPAPTPTSSTGVVEVTSASPPPSATQTPAPDACTTATEGFRPTELTIDSMGVTSPIISVGFDENGNPGAPPLDDAQGTAWFNGSVAPGSQEGTSMLSIHTYRHGGALGNQLLEELENGAQLKVTDGEKTACYDVYDRVKVEEATFDPDGEEAHRLHARDGEPQVAIVVCDDFNWDTENWDTRVIWYAKEVA